MKNNNCNGCLTETEEMSKEEMLEYIRQLEEENARLKCRKHTTLTDGMTAQKELDFIFPSFQSRHWRRSSVYNSDFLHIRKLAMSTVNRVDDNNVFSEQKINELTEKEYWLVISCADEITRTVAKYKRQYLESVGREDIVKAFETGGKL